MSGTDILSGVFVVPLKASSERCRNLVRQWWAAVASAEKEHTGARQPARSAAPAPQHHRALVQDEPGNLQPGVPSPECTEQGGGSSVPTILFQTCYVLPFVRNSSNTLTVEEDPEWLWLH